MNKIFFSLALVANSGLLVALFLGLSIGDPTKLDAATRRLVSSHFLTALLVGMLVMLVHGVALTYFMGTGRWLEETITAYKLPQIGRERNLKLKGRVIPAMVFCIVLLVFTFALGAMSDPGSAHPKKWAPLAHFSMAITTVSPV